MRRFHRDVERETSRSRRSIGKLGAAVGAGLVGGTAALAAFGAKAVSTASDIQESLTKNQRLFGRYAAEVEAFAETSARSFGISRAAALAYTGVFGNLARALGIGQRESAGLSVRLTKLAADMASFNNTSIEDALDALRSGLVGEQEPLRRYGVAVTQAALVTEAARVGIVKVSRDSLAYRTALVQVEVAQKAQAAAARRFGAGSLEARRANVALETANQRLARTLRGSTGELRAQERVQATLSLIYRQTRQAQGDFARTSDGLANQQRILSARLSDVSGEIGGRLLPVALKLVGGFNDLLTQAQAGTGVFGDVRDVFGDAAGAGSMLYAVLGPVVGLVARVTFGATGMALSLLQTRTGMVLLSAAAGALVGRMIALGAAWAIGKLVTFIASLRTMVATMGVLRAVYIAQTGVTNASTVAVLRFALAQGAATAASRGLAGAMASTGFGALLVIVGTVAGALLGFSRSTDRSTTSAKQLNEALRNQADALRAVRDIDLDVAQRRADLRSASVGVEAAEQRLGKLRRQGRQGTLAYRQAEADLTQARIQQRRAQRDLGDATADATRKQQDAKDATAEAVSVSARRITTLKGEADALRDELAHEQKLARGIRGVGVQTNQRAEAQKRAAVVAGQLAAKERELRRELSRQSVINGLREAVTRLTRRLSGLDETSGAYRRTAARLRSTQDTLNDVLNKVPGATRKAQRGFGTLSGTVGGLGGAMGDVSTYTESATNQLLSAFGAKPLRVGVRPFKLSPGQRFMRALGLGPLQRGGGMKVPGTGPGDTVHLEAMVEPGESVFVLNRNASRELAMLQSFNAAVPRFQEGGQLGVPKGGFPDAAGALPGLDALAWVLARRFGLSVVSGLRPGAITTTGNPSDHGWGGAIDVSNGITTPQMDAAYAYLTGTAIRQAIKQILYRTMIGGDHFNHIHVALLPQFASSAQAVMSMLGGGAFGLLPRMSVQGPDGPLTDMVRGAAAKLRGAANEYLTDRMGSLATPVGGAGGDAFAKGKYGKDQLKALWVQAGGPMGAANLAAAVALAESGGNPNSINNNTDGSIDRGLWQINSVHGALSTMDPLANARSAVSISSGGSNWNPWVAYTNGNYRHFLQQGGLLRLARGGNLRRALGRTVNVLRGRNARRRSRVLRGFLRRIAGIGLARGTLRRLGEFERNATVYGDHADLAAQLVGANGEPGQFGGKGEADWLGLQLQALFNWRNLMTKARSRVESRLRQVIDLIERAQRRLHEIAQTIIEQGRIKADLEAGLDKLRDDPRGARRNLEDRLRRLRRNPRRNRLEIESVERQLRALEGDRREQARRLRERIHDITVAQAGRVRQRDNLRDRILPAFARRREDMGTDLESYRDNLETVQGPGQKMEPLGQLPALGVLGGSIFQAQLRLRDLLAPPPPIEDGSGGLGPGDDTGGDTSGGGDTGPSERDLLSQELIDRANQRAYIANRQFDVLRQVPFGGVFHEGGVVGGRPGQEVLALLEAGERITPASADGAGSMGATVLIYGDIVSSHPDPVALLIGDQRFPVAVQKANRAAIRSGRGSGRAGVIRRG